MKSETKIYAVLMTVALTVVFGLALANMRSANQSIVPQIQKVFAPASPKIKSVRFSCGDGQVYSHVLIDNQTPFAISKVGIGFYVVEEGRRVPLDSYYREVKIPGGINAGESRSVGAAVMAKVFPSCPGDPPNEPKNKKWVAVLQMYRDYEKDEDTSTESPRCDGVYHDASKETIKSVGDPDNTTSIIEMLDQRFGN